MFASLQESYGLSVTPVHASLVVALAIGLTFGVLAQVSSFCLRRGIAGEPGERSSALAVWLTAMAFAVTGTQVLVASGYIDFSEHRFHASALPLVAIITGGLLFGCGMVLTRGCISRLTVLTGSGNLRALIVLVLFAIVAHSTQKGVLSPLRVWLGSYTLDVSNSVSLAALPGGALAWTVAIAAVVAWRVKQSDAQSSHLVIGALIGLLIPLAWLATGFVLQDDFDPIIMQSLSFTLPASDTLFWLIASSSIPAGFGTGLIGGVIIGSTATHLLRGQFQWQSFESPLQTGRYMTGATLMGIGGTLAGGCTLGAGLSGVATLGVAAFVALASIVAGAAICHRLTTTDQVRLQAPGIARPGPA